jgi:hypothetical protein
VISDERSSDPNLSLVTLHSSLGNFLPQRCQSAKEILLAGDSDDLIP